MKISCRGCGKIYRIDEDKLPATGKAVMTCPACGVRIEIGRSADPESRAESALTEPVSRDSEPEAPSASFEGSAAAASHTSFPEVEDEGTGFEFFEPGTKTALVFCPDYEAMTQLEAVLKNQDFEIRSISSASEVQLRFRYHIYDLLILYQSGPEPENRLGEIIQWINSVNMDIRRRILVVHISMNGNRNDSMQAFTMGVDVTISPLDIAALPEILDKIQSAKEARYRIFRECMGRVKEEAF